MVSQDHEMTRKPAASLLFTRRKFLKMSVPAATSSRLVNGPCSSISNPPCFYIASGDPVHARRSMIGSSKIPDAITRYHIIFRFRSEFDSYGGYVLVNICVIKSFFGACSKNQDE